MKRKIVLLMYFLILSVSGSMLRASETVVVGTVRSLIDKTPLEAVNIYFQGTHHGVQSDKDGFFYIKSSGNENILVFSSVGFRTKTIKIKSGETSGVQVELIEDINMLADLFVIPGANPALELMKKVRENVSHSEFAGINLSTHITEQEMVMLQKDSLSSNTGIFELLKEGTITSKDNQVFLPLYLSESQCLMQSGNTTVLKSESHANPENLKLLLEKITGEVKTNLNFYNDEIQLFGKKFISPVTLSGKNFYKYYLLDSIGSGNSKSYRVKFKSNNPGTLAFNGEMFIDSGSSGIKEIRAELPRFVNLNFVRDLQLKLKFQSYENKVNLPVYEEMILKLEQDIFPDKPEFNSGLFMFRTVQFSRDSSVNIRENSFAGTDFIKDEISKSISDISKNKIFKTAKWLADVFVTGYAQFGKLDLGKVNQLARLTDAEGFRITVPVRTNENLWKNFSIGGYWGYGFKNRFHACSGEFSYKLPLIRKTVFNISYTNDLFRIDYDINNFKLKEDPLLSADEDISGTLFSFKSAGKLNQRKVLNFSLMHDISDDFEMSVYYRKINTFSGLTLPLISADKVYDKIGHQSVTLHTRISFDEKSFEDHLQRLYVYNNKPVITFDVEAGRTSLAAGNHNFLKFKSEIRQKLDFPSGQWSYSIEGGAVFGKVPYYLLDIPVGNQSSVFRRNAFTMMNIMEYGLDKYIAIHQELLLNGLIFNYIPIVKNLKLREIFTLKCLVGSLEQHQQPLLIFPDYMKELNTPYVEAGAGVTNIFRIFTIQVFRRFTDTDLPGVRKWGLITGIRFNF